MATFDNHDAVAIAGKILERLGDKSLELSAESRAKILQDLNDALNVLIEAPSEPASFAPENNDEEVSPMSSFTPPIPQDAPSAESSQTTVPDDNSAFSKELLQHIDDVRSGRIEPRAISDNLKSDVARHEINRCRGDIANEGLWNGNMGWRSAADFYAAISYIWVNAREVFTKFDDFREIIEDRSKWNQTYFETQRNYLRHNFSLERLCHLVMVYDYLHGREVHIAPPPVTRPKITVVPEKKHPFGNDSASTNTSSTSLRSHKNWMFLCIGGVVFVLVALIAAFFLLRNKSHLDSGTEDNVQQQSQQAQQSSAPASSQDRMPIGGRNKSATGGVKDNPAPAKETGSEKK